MKYEFALYQSKEYLIAEQQGAILWLIDKYGEEFPVHKENIDNIITKEFK